MAAILGLDDDAVKEACAEAAGDEVVAAVNFNAPGQVVIAGHTAAVERAIAAAKSRGAKRAMPLPVSVPSPGIQFVTNPSTGLRSNLSAPALSGERTMRGSGLHARASVSIGYFVKF
jgi:hypothetical protein